MTENLLEQLEEKVTALLAELDILRHEVDDLKQENSVLNTTQAHYTKKLQALLSLFDTMDNAEELEEAHDYATA